MERASSAGSCVQQTTIANVNARRLQGSLCRTLLNSESIGNYMKKSGREEQGTSFSPFSLRIQLQMWILRSRKLQMAVGQHGRRDNRSTIGLFMRTEISEENGARLYLIDEAIRKVEIKMHIREAEDCIWTLHREYIIVLEMEGYKDISQTKTRISIKHMMFRLKPLFLKARIRRIISWRKSENFDKKDFGPFMQEVMSQGQQYRLEKDLFFWTN